MKKIVIIILSIALFVSGLTIMPVKAVDSLSANDWKNTAIVAPGNGKLIGAGHIDIKWNNNLENVSKYSVYVDSKLVRTVNASSAEKMSVDFYTVQISAHSTYIVAEQNGGAKVQTPTVTFYVTKKGICVNDVDMGVAVDPAAMNVGWYYNWGTRSFKETGFENTKFYDLEFVPMFWKDPDDGYTDSFARFSAQGYKYVLGFNEPDLSWEAGIKADVARRTWMNDFVKKRGNILLGSPAVSTFPQWNTWWSNYWSVLPDSGKSATNFIAVHNYNKYYNGKETALQYLEQIDECYNKYRKPIWITE
nr:glycoside hydrolase family protein [Eubacterium sp.]